MEIQRNAPNLSGARECPACTAIIAKDAAVCIHCGYDFKTGQAPVPPRRRPARWIRVLLVLGLLAILAVAAGRLWRRVQALAPTASPPEPAPATAPAPAGRKAFDAKKAEAEARFRRELDEREPMYKTNDTVELRRKNGLVDKGVYTGISGTGPGRVALLATPTGEIGVPLVTLDNPSRRRMDALYREAFTQHMLSIGGEVPGGEFPAE